MCMLTASADTAQRCLQCRWHANLPLPKCMVHRAKCHAMVAYVSVGADCEKHSMPSDDTAAALHLLAGADQALLGNQPYDTTAHAACSTLAAAVYSSWAVCKDHLSERLSSFQPKLATAHKANAAHLKPAHRRSTPAYWARCQHC
jgi:hypothetical protein